MGGDGDGTEKILGPIPIIRPYTVYDSDPSKCLEIMRCSNKVPKSVTHDVTRGRKPGAVARSEACPLGMQTAPSSIPTSGTFFRGDLVMK